MFDIEPEGWREVRLGDVASINPDSLGQRTDPAFGFGYIDISQIEQPGICAGWTPTTFGKAPSRARRRVRDDDIIVSTVRPYLRAFAKVPKSDGPLVASTGFAVVRANSEADQDFLFQHIMADIFVEHLKPRMTGSNYPAVSAGDVSDYPFRLPPLDEQRRIAEVLRSVDEAIATAESATSQFGRVIEQEANAVIDKLFADATVRQVALGEIALVKGGKRLPKGSAYEESPTANRYIRVTDWADYQIDGSNVRCISDETASAIRRYTISSRDLFISIAGSIGLVAAVPSDLDGAYLTENAAKIVVVDRGAVDATYLLVALRSELLAAQIRQQKGIGGGVPKLALFRIEELRLPLPKIEVQREVAASYLSLKFARRQSQDSLNAVTKLKVDLAADLLSGRIRVPA